MFLATIQSCIAGNVPLPAHAPGTINHRALALHHLHDRLTTESCLAKFQAPSTDREERDPQPSDKANKEVAHFSQNPDLPNPAKAWSITTLLPPASPHPLSTSPRFFDALPEDGYSRLAGDGIYELAAIRLVTSRREGCCFIALGCL